MLVKVYVITRYKGYGGKMKTWISTGIIVFCVLVIAIFAFLYHSIRSPLKEENEQAVEYVLKNTDVTEITDVDFYHGSESYQVVTGKNTTGDELIIWFKSPEDELVIRKKKEGLSMEKAKQIAEQRLKMKELQNIRLGIENGLPVYEITYIDDENRQGFYYMTFNDGTFVKRYNLKRE